MVRGGQEIMHTQNPQPKVATPPPVSRLSGEEQARVRIQRGALQRLLGNLGVLLLVPSHRHSHAVVVSLESTHLRAGGALRG